MSISATSIRPATTMPKDRHTCQRCVSAYFIKTKHPEHRIGCRDCRLYLTTVDAA